MFETGKKDMIHSNSFAVESTVDLTSILSVLPASQTLFLHAFSHV